MSCSLLARSKEGSCISLDLEVGSTFLILGYFEAIEQKYFPCRTISHGYVVFF